jgi:hypothetical protein
MPSNLFSFSAKPAIVRVSRWALIAPEQQEQRAFEHEPRQKPLSELKLVFAWCLVARLQSQPFSRG